MTRDQPETEVENTAPEAKPTGERGSFDVTIDDGFAAGHGSTVRRRISTGTLIMGGVVILAGASLWSMRAIDRAAASAPVGSNETEILVNKALASKGDASAPLPPEVRPLLDSSEGDSGVQVPLKDLRKNPFVLWDVPKGSPEPSDPVEQPVLDTRAARIAEWEKLVDSAAAAIKLQSTMSGVGSQGATGIANINGNMMRIGDLFGVDGSEIEFTIDAIERDTITVRSYSSELKHERFVTVKVNRKW